MLFNSLVFLFKFLPLLLLVYYVVPKSFRNYILLAFSLGFYAWGGISYFLLLVISLGVNYLVVRFIANHNDKSKLWLIIGIVFNIVVIVSFKYLDFFIDNINFLKSHVFHADNAIENLNIVLPLGISFFTFQQMSMLIDVYKNKNEPKPKFLDTSLYISFFPQLIAGPIVRYNDIINQIRERHESIGLFKSGVKRFVFGLFKKVIIANQMAVIADSILDSSVLELNSSVAWLGIICYSFQIYFDFSGYSDMAIGLGRMFGFKILENFNFPYISTSIKEFWRRWHISLSSWFRDYLYIPLGGNRIGVKRTYINLFIVFLLTGFWHGATWSFVFWGVFHGLFLIIERIGFGKILDRIPKFFSWLYTMLIVIIAWVFFRIEDFSQAFDFTIRMFSLKESNPQSVITYLNIENIFVLVLAVILSSSILSKIKLKWFNKKETIPMQIIESVFVISIFLYCIVYINSGSYSPFIYFRF